MDGNRRRRLGSIPALDGTAFQITTLLLQEERRLGAIGRRRFYVRRSLRLLPALGVAMTHRLLPSCSASR